MNFYAGNTYWNKTEIATFQFKKLTEILDVDTLSIGSGSSSANTGLLQYSSDKRISAFAKDLGVENGTCYSVARVFILKDLLKDLSNPYEKLLRVDQ